jgi:TRAP-type C4-dicarboxylate transport system substrate-binding protein
MYRNRRILMVCLSVLLVTIFSIAPAVLAQKPVKLKFAAVHGTPGKAPLADVIVGWQQEVTKRTNGAITFENFWGAAMGAPAEHIDLLKNGVIDVVQTASLYTITRTPLDNFEYTIPFGVTDYEIVTNAKRQMAKEIPEFGKEWAREANGIIIYNHPQMEYHFLSKTPLRTLADFDGKKVGLIGRYFGRWMPPGAVPVVRPGHERYDMLKTGVSTVDLNPLDNQIIFKLNEVTNYFITNLVPLVACPLPVIMNLKVFNSFPPETQKIIMQAGRNAELRACREVFPLWYDRAIKEWKSKGMELVEFRKDERQKWIDGLEDIPAEWAKEMEGKGLPGFKIIQRWQEITAQMGHKWTRKWGVKK